MSVVQASCGSQQYVMRALPRFEQVSISEFGELNFMDVMRQPQVDPRGDSHAVAQYFLKVCPYELRVFAFVLVWQQLRHHDQSFVV